VARQRRLTGVLVTRHANEAGAEATPNLSLHRVSLRFRDAATERRFQADHLQQALLSLRTSLLGAAVTYGSFGLLDVYMIPDASDIAAWIRYGLVCPMLLGVMLLSYSTWFPRVAQVALSATMLVCGLGIVAMIAVAGEPGRSVYYAGLMLVVIIGSSIVPIGWMAVCSVSLTVLAAYQVVATRVSPVPHLMLINNDFFLFAAVAAGIGASYLQELKIRRIFIRDEGLRLARQQSDFLRAEAEEASRAKSEFLAVMSHELRTPLNAILGFSEIMRMRLFGPIGSERYASYADDIHKSAQHLLGIISDILDFSKAEVGTLSLHEEPVAILGALDQCLHLLHGRAAELGLRLSLEAPTAACPTVHGDERLMKQAFLNVLGNAIKFTPSGGVVKAHLECPADGRAVLHFTDTGIGIAAADLPRVVEPFVQLESAFSRKHGGAGLGLPLVKKIMELHEGGLDIESTPGAGTTVTLWFPAKRVSFPVNQAQAGAA
jgi:signal transduction histidine kinase